MALRPSLPGLSRRTFVAGTAAASLVGVVAKAATDPGELGFLVLGDWGRDGASRQRDVAAAMGQAAAARGSRFTVTVGDNFYPAGVQTATDARWRTSFEDVYTAPALQSPWYAVLGNHDYRGRPEAQLAYAATSARWRMPARYYQQSLAIPGGAGVDLFMLDTSPMVRRYSAGSEDAAIRDNVAGQDVAAQLRWLEAALAASRAKWKLVFGHHPVFSGGSAHGSTPELIATVKPLLERHGVQAYVSGHDHDLQHIEVDDVTYIGTGAGSETRPVKSIPGTKFCSDRSGFTAFTIKDQRLFVEFIDYTTNILHQTEISIDRTIQSPA